MSGTEANLRRGLHAYRGMRINGQRVANVVIPARVERDVEAIDMINSSLSGGYDDDRY